MVFLILFSLKRIPDSIAKDIEKFCSYIYPLNDVYIRKVKVVKKPKFDFELKNFNFSN